LVSDNYDIIVAGGGAAGYFSAINIAIKNPGFKILILEKSQKTLDKVRISGGGRCNVTHACWEPKELVKFYPRGHKELLGPFHQFMCGDMLMWLDKHNVPTKIEKDGRIFPASNKSSSIIECFNKLVEKHNIEIKLSEGIENFEGNKGDFIVETSTGNKIKCSYLIIATGSSKKLWNILKTKEIKITEPVPSLFTFKIEDPLITGLPGLSVESAEVSIDGFKMRTTGPVLITHWGLSGPGILKLSSWAARFLYEKSYKFTIRLNWINRSEVKILEEILAFKKQYGKKEIFSHNPFSIPKRLWKNMLKITEINQLNWADINKKQIKRLAEILTNCKFEVDGKSTNKDEFVTSGGVILSQINFKNMEVKSQPGIFMAGEVLDIDALTGGFNFQAAWTESWLISENKFN